MSAGRDMGRVWPLGVVMAALVGVWIVTFYVVAALDPVAFEATGRVSARAMVEFGIKDDERVAAGRVAGLVRSGLVHHSLSHLALNGVGLTLFAGLLWRLTPRAQRTLRRAAVVAALAVVASTGGFVLSFAVGSGLSAGASGAVFGMLGALPLALVARSDLASAPVRWGLAGALLALGVLGAVAAGPQGVDQAAHLGGLLAGVPLGYAQTRPLGRRVLVALALVLVVVGFTPA